MSVLFTSRPKFVAIALVILVALMRSIDGVIVRILSENLNPFLIVFFRNFFALVVFLPWIFKNKSILKTNYFFAHPVRGGLKILALAALFLAIKTENLVDVTSIWFTSPIFLMCGATLFLGENLNFKRIMAGLIGFSGVIIILRPGQETMSYNLFWALLGAIIIATILIMLKIMVKKDSTETLTAWNLIVSVPIAAIPAYFFWNSPSMEEYILLFIQGLLNVGLMVCMTKAYSLAEASFLAPIDFIRLPIISLFAFLFFNESPTIFGIIGAILIFSSVFIISSEKERIKINSD